MHVCVYVCLYVYCVGALVVMISCSRCSFVNVVVVVGVIEMRWCGDVVVVVMFERKVGGRWSCWMMRFDVMRCDGSRGGEKQRRAFRSEWLLQGCGAHFWKRMRFSSADASIKGSVKW